MWRARQRLRWPGDRRLCGLRGLFGGGDRGSSLLGSYRGGLGASVSHEKYVSWEGTGGEVVVL